jgi:hypothetical protein
MTNLAEKEVFIMTCRHCGRSKVNRPRGLCWSCYYTPGVRERYPSTSKFAYRGNGTGNGAAPLPLEPTTARPGSPEKVAVLEERARRRQALWHPLDARMDSQDLNENRGSKIDDRKSTSPNCLHPRSSILDPHSSSIPDPRSSSILNLRSSILDPQSSALDPRSSILNLPSSLQGVA